MVPKISLLHNNLRCFQNQRKDPARIQADFLKGGMSVQKVTNKKIFVVLPYVVIGGGLPLNDIGFILVQATCLRLV